MDVVVLFFLLGVIARLGKSDLKLPQALYETLSVYLLLAIGLKGGVELHRSEMKDVLPQVVACILVGGTIPMLLTPLFRFAGLKHVDAAALAAHFGSVSVVTYAVAVSALQKRGVDLEPHAALWVAVMEAPGIVVGIVLARLALAKAQPDARSVAWGPLLHEVLFGKSIVLLLGGIAIGAVMGNEGLKPIAPLFTELFRGVLAVFLLELGLVVGGQMSELKRFGLRLILLGVVTPLSLGILGALVAKALGLSLGGIAVFATLVASASYIAAPTAVRLAVPQANAGLSIATALGIAFPFNVLIGIHIYFAFAQWLIAQ